MPTSGLDILLHLFVLNRKIFLYPCILDTTLKIEHIIRVLFKKHKVLVYCIPHILFNRSLYVPVPLSIQMRIRHNICFWLLFRSNILSINTARQQKYRDYQSNVFPHFSSYHFAHKYSIYCSLFSFIPPKSRLITF